MTEYATHAEFINKRKSGFLRFFDAVLWQDTTIPEILNMMKNIRIRRCRIGKIRMKGKS